MVTELHRRKLDLRVSFVELQLFKTVILNPKLYDAHAVGAASKYVISVHYAVQAVSAASMRAISACC